MTDTAYYKSESQDKTILERVEEAGWKDLSADEKMFLRYFDDVCVKGIWGHIKRGTVSTEFVTTVLMPVLHYGMICSDNKLDEFRLSVAEHFVEYKQAMEK